MIHVTNYYDAPSNPTLLMLSDRHHSLSLHSFRRQNARNVSQPTNPDPIAFIPFAGLGDINFSKEIPKPLTRLSDSLRVSCGHGAVYSTEHYDQVEPTHEGVTSYR